MVWSSARSTLIGPFVFAFVIWFSPNPSCSVPLVRLERHCSVYTFWGHGSSPLLRCRGTHPYGAPRKFQRYSPECVEGEFCEVRAATTTALPKALPNGASLFALFFVRLQDHRRAVPK